MRKTKSLHKSSKMSGGNTLVKDNDNVDLRSKAIYDNYVKNMKEINHNRQKEGRDPLPVRSLKEWQGD